MGGSQSKQEEVIIAQCAAGNEKKEIRVDLINKLSIEVKSLCDEINRFCSVSIKKENTNMEKFELKVAVSLLPIMTDKVTKQLIANIEMYDDFRKVLRLSQSYATVPDLIKDMKQFLLTRKSDTAIQQQLQMAKQHQQSIEDFGKSIEQMFVELTISQSNGDSNKYNILKPINERNAIKRFSYGLRNTRLSTIVAARNYDILEDAIRGAMDEDLSSNSEGAMLNYSRGTSRHRPQFRVHVSDLHTTDHSQQLSGCASINDGPIRCIRTPKPPGTVKRRWSDEELTMLARTEAGLIVEAGTCTNITLAARLSGTGRTLEAIKGQKHSTAYKSKVLEYVEKMRIAATVREVELSRETTTPVEDQPTIDSRVQTADLDDPFDELTSDRRETAELDLTTLNKLVDRTNIAHFSTWKVPEAFFKVECPSKSNITLVTRRYGAAWLDFHLLTLFLNATSESELTSLCSKLRGDRVKVEGKSGAQFHLPNL
ncbi:unnamed protein product, partial [Leptidea sinapis]